VATNLLPVLTLIEEAVTIWLDGATPPAKSQSETIGDRAFPIAASSI